MTNEKIKWELLSQSKEFDCCAMQGDSVSTIKKGEIDGIKFLLFETYEAYYNAQSKGMQYKVISSNIFPLNSQ